MADDCLNRMCKFLEEWTRETGGNKLKTVKQLRAFLELNKQRGITIGQVRHIVDSSQPSMYVTVQNLEEVGLGKKQQDPFDGKSHIFIPSEKGKELLDILEK